MHEMLNDDLGHLSVSKSVHRVASCGFTLQTWLNGSGSYLGWRLLEAQGVVLDGGPNASQRGGRILYNHLYCCFYVTLGHAVQY